MKKLRKLYYRIFKKYKVLETVFVTYDEGDKLIRESQHLSEINRWVLAKEEDYNKIYCMVYLCRKVRITE